MAFLVFLLYLAMVLLRPTDRWAALDGLPVLAGTALLGLVTAAARLVVARGPTMRAPQIYLVLIFLLWAMASLALADRWLGGALFVFEDLRPQVILFLLVVLNLTSERRVRITAAFLVGLMVVCVIEGALAYHSGYGADTFVIRARAVAEETAGSFESPADREVVRIRGLGELHDPNDLAQALVAIMPLAFLLMRRRAGLHNLAVVWLPVALMLYGVYLTRSRGGLLSLLVVIFLVFQHRLGRMASFAVSAVAGVAFLGIGFAGGRQLGVDESALGRMEAWSEGLQMLKSSPVWGVGYSNFTELHHLVAHNSFVHCFAELGLVGYFVWLALVAVTLGQALAAARQFTPQPLAAAARLGLFSLAGFLSGAWFLSRTYSTMLFLLIAFLTAILDLTRRDSPPARTLSVPGWLIVIGALEIGSIALFYVVVQFVY